MNQKMWGNNTIHTDFAKERPGTKPPTVQEESVPPSQTLFVANLPNEADRTMLYSIFSRFGSILDVRLLADKVTGATKGVAFVDFGIKESAMAAKEELDGTTLLGKTMKVMYSSNPSKKTASYASVPPMPTMDPLYYTATFDPTPEAYSQWTATPTHYGSTK
eukprot:TRINITY_DN5202_c0_g1_i1.p1 TRINITY_DN5202_c0_g1~~TRINITY_DN5202_c0_g1_i1.p1  ORF type:complete len:162 (-),score=31.45 TRINITY_DN5202_c0_g1_i1:27-512(-)